MNDRLGLSLWQALLVMGACLVIGGLAAFIAVLVCYFLLNFGGMEDPDKHGIASNPAVRIGGVLIVVYLLLNLSFQQYSLSLPSFSDDNVAVLAGALPFFVLGLYEDLRGVLSARFRFISMLLIAAWLLIFESRFVLLPVQVPIVDALILNHALAAWVFTAVCLTFLPNAFNTADGANGLVAGISLVAVLLLAGAAPAGLAGFLHSAAVGCLIFLIYNLSTGRFFLGDGGAYFLGALVGLCLILVANLTNVSMWFLVTLVFYPVADLVFSVVRRLGTGRAPFSADNEHLHNLIHEQLRQRLPSAKWANSITGLSVVVVFSGSVLVVVQFGAIDLQSHHWLWVCALQWCVYALLWGVLRRHRGN